MPPPFSRSRILGLGTSEFASILDLMQAVRIPFTIFGLLIHVPELQLIDNRCTNHRFLGRRMIKLVEARGEFPPYLFVRGVHRISDNAISGGGFADIYKGTIEGKSKSYLVAFKVLRIFDHSRGDEAVLKVCPASSLYLMTCLGLSTVDLAVLQRSHDMEDVQP